MLSWWSEPRARTPAIRGGKFFLFPLLYCAPPDDWCPYQCPIFSSLTLHLPIDAIPLTSLPFLTHVRHLLRCVSPPCCVSRPDSYLPISAVGAH